MRVDFICFPIATSFLLSIFMVIISISSLFLERIRTFIYSYILKFSCFEFIGIGDKRFTVIYSFIVLCSILNILVHT